MKLGIHLLGYDVPLRSVVDISRMADASTIDSVWIGEYFHEGYAVSTAVAAATSRLRIGTAATLALPRSPLITAMAVRDVAELSTGRFTVGLGSQVKRGLRRWHGLDVERPVAMMADYIGAVRACLRALRGEGDLFESEHWRLDLRGFAPVSGTVADPAILLAAVGPKMVEAAAGSADGLIGHILWSPRYLRDVVRPTVEKVNPTRPFEMATTVVLATHPDVATVRADAKRTLAFYASTRSYAGRLAEDGFAVEAAACAAAAGRRDPVAMVEAVSDKMLDTYAVSCAPDELGDRLAERYPDFDTVIAIPAYYQTPTDRVIEQQLALLDHKPSAPAGAG